MIAEAFLPSFGAGGIGGVAAFTFGSPLLFRGAPGIALSWPVILGATATSAGIFALALLPIRQRIRRPSQ
ncbi:hypothetical protein MSC49_36730 (plasmid) [Methylosinus sp. C49]|uniref:hypothetical protein n=1 Tax=Methylosinus sp. C49 TaxID=2699395 RepID=UPI001366ABCF|nr:hypothetical protein [Methylosinus sp. C49]BBU63738.1 hypothetical protein MSC49_36730 [Methylosinus sp. C49]